MTSDCHPWCAGFPPRTRRRPSLVGLLPQDRFQQEVLSATRTNEGILLLKISEFGVALMMGDGPPRSVCRHRSQTTQCCCGSKDHGGEQLGKRRPRGRHVSVEKVNESKPDRRRIVNLRSVVKTAEVRNLR